jgi:regulator of sigma E protease
VEKGYPAYEAGVRTGDMIIEVNGTKISEWQDLLREMAFTRVAPMNFVFQRDGKIFNVTITPKEVEEKSELGNVIKRKKIGIGPTKMIWKEEGIFSAFPKSIHVAYTMTKTTIRGFYHMITGDISTKEIGGPIAIIQLTGKQAQGGIWSLVTFVAFISINLGILNLLPIPVLDGGHILFNFIEIIIRRKVPEKTVANAQKVGLTLLVMLMAFAFYNDIVRLLHTKTFLDKIPAFLKVFSGK